MKLRLTDHAITRYHERVKPALLRRQAKAELEALVAAVDGPCARPGWLPADDRHEGANYIELSDGVVGALDRGRVVTVIVRASYSPERRAAKKAARKQGQRWKYGRSGKGNRRDRGDGENWGKAA